MVESRQLLVHNYLCQNGMSSLAKAPLRNPSSTVWYILLHRNELKGDSLRKKINTLFCDIQLFKLLPNTSLTDILLQKGGRHHRNSGQHHRIKHQ